MWVALGNPCTAPFEGLSWPTSLTGVGVSRGFGHQPIA